MINVLTILVTVPIVIFGTAVLVMIIYSFVGRE